MSEYKKVDRKVSGFEVLLLIVGVVVIISGVYLFNVLLEQQYQLIEYVTFVILWLMLVFALIISAIAENAREELGVIIQENNREIKLLRDISAEHLEEIKLLRETMTKKKK